MIHPQAIINSKAELGNNVDVGPFSVIGPDVEIGDNTWIGPHVTITGSTAIGRNNKIYQYSSIGEAPQHVEYRGEPTRLEVGDDNTIREYCSFNRGTVEGSGVTRVNDGNFFMAYAHVAHDCIIDDHTIFVNCASLAGHVLVGDYAILGGFTSIHQFCRIGAHSMTGLGTVVHKDIPPYVLANGNNAKPHGINVRGLKRRKFSLVAIEALRRAYKVIYKSGLNLTEAMEALEDEDKEIPEVAALVSFIRSSERGIIR